MRLSSERIGGMSLIVGAALFAAYAAMFPFVIPVGAGTYDFAKAVLDPDWVKLALVAFIGILLMLVGFYAVYARVRAKSGLLGAAGFLLIEAAYLLQACKVTWELFLYPIIAAHPESAFLLRDRIISHDPSVAAFREVGSAAIFLGVTLFCLAIYRSGEYPKAAPILIFTGAIVYAAGPMISIFVSIAGIFVLAIGCLLLGARLFNAKKV